MEINQLRPISILCFLSKTLEKILHIQLTIVSFLSISQCFALDTVRQLLCYTLLVTFQRRLTLSVSYKLNVDLTNIKHYCDQHCIQINHSKCFTVDFCFSTVHDSFGWRYTIKIKKYGHNNCERSQKSRCYAWHNIMV